MRANCNRGFHRILTAAITITMVTGLALPLQTESASAAYSIPKISDKRVINAKITPLKKGGNRLNLRLEAVQDVYGYDTVQGCCYGRGYIYYLLRCRSKDRCKIVKMKSSNKKVVKISRSLKLNHGNDITYNTKTRKLVVAHAKPTRTKISVISSKSLKIEKTKTIKLPKKLPGARWSRIKKKGGYQGFSSIAFNSKHNQYVVQLYKSRDFLFLNSKFKPVRYVVPSNWDSQLYQGIESFGNRIIVCNSRVSGKPNNVLSVYDWNGKYLSKVTLGRSMELESVFHQGKKLYVTYYCAYIARYQWDRKIVRDPKKGRIHTYYKKRKPDKYYLNRDGFIYRVTNL